MSREIEDLPARIKKLEDDLLEIKSKQFSGAGNIKAYYWASDNDYDLYFVSNARIIRYMMTITHSGDSPAQRIHIDWAQSNISTKPLQDYSGVYTDLQIQQLPITDEGKVQNLLSFRNTSYPPEFTGGTTSYNLWIKFILYSSAPITNVQFSRYS